MKMFVLILNTLSKSDQAVQGGHAVAEYMFEHDNQSEWWNGTLIYLRATPDQLLDHKQRRRNNIQDKNGDLYDVCAIGFRESDRNNELTAVAFVSDDDDPYYLDYRLI